jgi:hypothetical protein
MPKRSASALDPAVQSNQSVGNSVVENNFLSEPKRSGKWSHEEEAYAAKLITDFDEGTLVDCENGVTLRVYLARKLNCAPMRISKKFAGKCIGKVRVNLKNVSFIYSSFVLSCVFIFKHSSMLLKESWVVLWILIPELWPQRMHYSCTRMLMLVCQIAKATECIQGHTATYLSIIMVLTNNSVAVLVILM